MQNPGTLSWEYSDLLKTPDRGVGAASLKMGLSFRTRSLNSGKPCEALSLLGYCASERIASICLISRPPPPHACLLLFASFHLQVGLLQPTACMYYCFLEVRRPSDGLQFPKQRAGWWCNINIWRVGAAAWSKRHWFCVPHLFKNTRLATYEEAWRCLSLWLNWDL